MSRELVAISALAAMKFYEPLFPGDTIPFQAVAAAIAVNNGERNAESLSTFRDEMEKRRTSLQSIVMDYRLKRGYLLAALHTLTIIAIAIAETEPNTRDIEDVERLRRQAADMTTGVSLSLA